MAAIERASSDAGIATTTLTTDHGLDEDAGHTSGLIGGDRRAQRILVAKRIGFYKVAPGMVPYLLKHVREYDAVHIHALFSFAPVAAALIARRARVPYVVRPLGTLSRYGVGTRRRWLKRLSIALIEGPILRHAAAIHFTSQSEYEEAQSLGFDCRRGIVIPLGIDNPTGNDKTASIENASSAARAQGGGKPELTGRRVVLFLSRLDPKKNVEALIDAYAISQDLRGMSRLVIAGAGSASYVASLQQRAVAAGIADQITWLGHVAATDKAAAFRASDVFVLPSRSENFGIAAAEAMLAGLPCILSKDVAIANDAEAAGAAVTTEPEPELLAAAIVTLLADQARCRRMGQRARDYAAATYSTAKMAERLTALYRSILVPKTEAAPELPR